MGVTPFDMPRAAIRRVPLGVQVHGVVLLDSLGGGLVVEVDMIQDRQVEENRAMGKSEELEHTAADVAELSESDMEQVCAGNFFADLEEGLRRIFADDKKPKK